jgi:hypothetical protein
MSATNEPDNMDQIVSFTGTVSWPLFKRAQWTHVGRRWLLLLLFPVIMTAYAWWAPGTFGSSWAMVFAAAFVWVPMMIASSLFTWRRTYTKTPFLHQRLTGSVSSQRLVVEAETGRTDITWNQFVRIRDGKDFLLLYHGPYQFNILAREFFESDADWETARRFATRAS